MSIIEKVGIKPITADYSAKVWGQTEDVVKLITVKKLEQQRNEMLEHEILNKKDAHLAMIEMENDIPDMGKIFNLLGNIVARSANGVEKVAGKSWEEIERLSNG